MRYKVYKNGEHINTIVASPEFAEGYVAETGYTLEADPEPVEPEPDPRDTAFADPQADTDEAVIDLDYRLTLLELGLTE